MKSKTKLFSVVLVTSLLLLITGCAFHPLQRSSKATFTISIANKMLSQSFMPDEPIEIIEYNVVGSGPEGTSFDETILPGKTLTLEGVQTGLWTVTAYGKNANAVTVGSASDTATVNPGENTSMTLYVIPLAGDATLDSTITWEPNVLMSAWLDASLKRDTFVRTLNYNVDVSNAIGTLKLTDIDTSIGNWFTYILKIKNVSPDFVGGGIAAAVYFNGGFQTSINTHIFINKEGGVFTIDVDDSGMGYPLNVTIKSPIAFLDDNDPPITLTASESESIAGVVFNWYINGEVVAIDQASYQLNPASIEYGYRRVDCVAFSSGLARGGSTGFTFQRVNLTNPFVVGSAFWQKVAGEWIQFYADLTCKYATGGSVYEGKVYSFDATTVTIDGSIYNYYLGDNYINLTGSPLGGLYYIQ